MPGGAGFDGWFESAFSQGLESPRMAERLSLRRKRKNLYTRGPSWSSTLVLKKPQTFNLINSCCQIMLEKTPDFGELAPPGNNGPVRPSLSQ
jgi:hypothetical protein